MAYSMTIWQFDYPTQSFWDWWLMKKHFHGNVRYLKNRSYLYRPFAIIRDNMEIWVDMWDFGWTTLIFVWGTLRFHKSVFRCLLWRQLLQYIGEGKMLLTSNETRLARWSILPFVLLAQNTMSVAWSRNSSAVSLIAMAVVAEDLARASAADRQWTIL